LLAVQLSQPCGTIGLELVNLGLNFAFKARCTQVQIALCLGDRAIARVLIDIRDHILRKVQDTLQVARADVEQQTEPARHALDIPDVADRTGQLDMSHALATNAAVGHLDAALIANDALVASALVFAAGALPVLLGTKNAFAKQAVSLRTERTIIDRLGLGHLTV